jgi:hypothetical protein
VASHYSLTQSQAQVLTEDHVVEVDVAEVVDDVAEVEVVDLPVVEEAEAEAEVVVCRLTSSLPLCLPSSHQIHEQEETLNIQEHYLHTKHVSQHH